MRPNHRLFLLQGPVGLIVWLLVIVLPLQGLASIVTELRGPSHVHAQVDRLAALVDFRRVSGGVRTRVAHSHALAHRHHHAFDDDSVKFMNGDHYGAADKSKSSASAAIIVAFLPLPASNPSWLERDLTHPQQPTSLWTPKTAYPTRLDRPPQLLRT